jgi:hypothetical protein
VSLASTRRDANPHAAIAGAVDLDVLRQRYSDRNRTCVAKGGTAHFLRQGFSKVAVRALKCCPDRISSRDSTRQIRPAQIGVKHFEVSSPEDDLISSGEDRRCECRTSHIPRLPGA